MQSFIRKARVTNTAPSYDIAHGLSALHAMALQSQMVGAGYAFWSQGQRPGERLDPPKFGMELHHAQGPWLSWLGDYVKDLCAPDPVFQATRERVMPVWWGADLRHGNPVCMEFGYSSEQLDAFDLCYTRTGIRSGVAVPVRGPRSGGGYIGFLSNKAISDFLPDRRSIEAALLPAALGFLTECRRV